MRRGVVFAAIAGACVVVAGASVALSARGGGTKASAAVRIPAGPLVVFRSLDRKHAATYGDVAFAGAGAEDERTVEPLQCERVYFSGGRGLCLAKTSAIPIAYGARVFDRSFHVLHTIPLRGIPSRARISPDGRYGTATVFSAGHAYANPGTFSTRASIFDLARGKEIANLEQFTVTRDGKPVTARDRNFWGVTFERDSNRFYATMATGGKTYLIHGDVRARRAQTLHENVECPSLSPDGTRIAYKKRVGSGGAWHLTVLDLRTMRETPLAESRPVDDQAEWLDDAHVLYRIDEETWEARADGRGTPRRFLAAADSPAVVAG